LSLQPPASKPSSTLYLQVLAAIGLGVLVGVLAPEWGLALKPLGDGFIKLIKMVIAPIVFCTVVIGIAGMRDLRRVGRVGAKALLYFEVMTTVALVLGLFIVRTVRPGTGVHAKLETLDTHALEQTLSGSRPHGLVEHLLALIPESFVGAFIGGDVLQVLVVAVITGVALASLGERSAPVLSGLEQVATGLFAIISVIMRLAPLGAFGAMASTIAKHGLATLGNLGQLMLAFYATALIFVFGVLGVVMQLLGLSIFRLVRHLKAELLIVLGTSSSEPALPSLMTRLEALGCSREVVRLVVPTGYSFNLDGTCIYLTMASVFVAQALDVPLSLGDEVSLLVVLLLTSKGAAGVTGSGFVTLAATLSSVGTIPVGGISLLLGIDRFMSEARALTNLVGNAVATLVVARWENALDVAQARRVLAGKPDGPPKP
jgi:aerobic C4-dicarboxylate transport protein